MCTSFHHGLEIHVGYNTGSWKVGPAPMSGSRRAHKGEAAPHPASLRQFAEEKLEHSSQVPSKEVSPRSLRSAASSWKVTGMPATHLGTLCILHLGDRELMTPDRHSCRSGGWIQVLSNHEICLRVRMNDQVEEETLSVTGSLCLIL